jgi:hypothetical protein
MKKLLRASALLALLVVAKCGRQPKPTNQTTPWPTEQSPVCEITVNKNGDVVERCP